MVKSPAVVAVAAAIICFLVFVRSLAGDFVNFDDPYYVLNNEAIRHLDWSLVVWAFTAPMANWVPLTHISLAIDYRIWGLNPLGYHLTNILLHSINTGLVVLIADGLFRRRFAPDGNSDDGSFRYAGMLLFAALVFGIHPLRVESVAWITERKDVLNGIFSFSAVYFYLRYVAGKEKGDSAASRHYVISIVLFLFSLTAKTMSVTIPALLLVLDWYPLGRVKSARDMATLLAEKIPYLLLSALAALRMLTMTSKLGNLMPVDQFPVKLRIVASGNAIFEYVRLQLLPFGISPLHVIPSPVPLSYTVKTVLVVLATVAILALWKRCSWLTAAWCSFVGTLVPILAIFQANPMSFAAHCTYLPSVIPGIVAAAVCAEAVGRSPSARRVVPLLATALLLFYAGMTQFHISVWKDSEALWTRVIDIQPFDRPYFTRALHYVDAGRYQEAIDDYSVCLKFMTADRNPEAFNLYAFRGEALAKAGRYEEAIRDFSAAIDVYPHRLYYYHRGMALQALGREGEAEADLQRAGSARGQMYWFAR